MFEVGKDVVCIRDTKYDGYGCNEGDIVEVLGIEQHCNDTYLYVGYKVPEDHVGSVCSKCLHILSTTDWYMPSENFAPIEDWANAGEMVEELLEEQFEQLTA